MLSQGAKQHKSHLQEDIGLRGVYHILFFTFYEKKENSGIFYEEFYLTLDNKCVKYEVTYHGQEWVNKLKDSLNMRLTGLKQVKDSLKWISPDKRYYAYLLKV